MVNRSDEQTFHVALFSGPYKRRAMMGELVGENLVCNFVYVHDRLGPSNEYVMVVIARAKPDDAGALGQVEEVADELAELVSTGSKIDHVYTYDRKQLIPGAPK